MAVGGTSLARAAITVAAALAVASVAGCGREAAGVDSKRAIRAFDALQSAFARGDLAGVCAHMSEQARRQAGLFAHGRPGHCTDDLAEAFALTQPGPIRGTRPMPRATAASVEGDAAVVAASGATGDEIDVPLVHEGARWRLASFFGSSPSVARANARATASRPFPPAAPGERVRVADGPDFDCFPLVADRFPEIEGGCAMTASGSGVRLTVDTPFGRYDFGDCSLDYALRTDATGRTWTSQVSFGAPGSAGCADVGVCHDAEGSSLPWKGRLRADAGGVTHVMIACLDTCVGYFAGRLALRLTRVGGGWRVVSRGSTVGRSGLALRGRLNLQPAAIRIRSAT